MRADEAAAEWALRKDEPVAGSDETRQVRRLKELFHAEQPGMLRLAMLMVGEREVARDLVQESFLRVYSRIDDLDQPGAYLRTTLVNLCRSHHRHRDVVDRYAPAGPQAVPPPALPEDLSDVWLALEALPERQRHALVLRYYLDLSDDEIAELLGARPSTVRSLMSRGIAQLRKVVEP
jgi:RNA polymerase sigma-70 factor (sigma-E family)